MAYITIGGLDHVQGSAFSSTLQCRIVHSWELLDWISRTRMDKIPCSFTNFITTPELSGPFHISTDICHTQITEYYRIFTEDKTLLLSVSSFLSAWNIFLIYPVRFLPFRRYVSPDWSFKGHISCADPTEMIFYLLRSIPSAFLVRSDDYSRGLKLDTLEIITKWLQVSFRECSRQTLQT